MKHSKVRLEIKARRIFSEAFKREQVRELVEKRISIGQLTRLHEVSRSAVYKWLYKYSVHHQQKTNLVVEMQSESYKTQMLLQRVAELERIIGQKQLEIDFLNKLFELGSEELGFDLKKNFNARASNGTEPPGTGMAIK